MKFCDNCGTPLEENDIFCGECGFKHERLTTKCVECGAKIDEDAAFCSECGTKLAKKNKIFCSNCGIEVVEEAKFCMECGTPTSKESWMINVNKYQSPVQDFSDSQLEVPTNRITQPDENTISINFKGIPFNLKLILGHDYGTPDEISDFFIAQTPVTQVLWYAVTNFNPSSNTNNPNYPVTNITPQLAISFLVKLQNELGVKFELPSDRQWNYAYAGGHKSQNFIFSGSNDINEVGWTDRQLHAVGELYENEIGIVDMEGLVEELQKDGRKSAYSKNEKTLKDDNFVGFRFVVNIPVGECLMSSPLVEFIEKIKHVIAKHHAEDEEIVKKKAIEEAIRRRAEEKERKRKEEELVKSYEDPKTWSVKKIENKAGLVDPSGNWRIQPQFERFGKSLFNKYGLCMAVMDGKCGFIDSIGRWVIEPRFAAVGKFHRGLCRAEYQGKWGIIDIHGNWIVDPRFDDFKGDPDVFDYGFMAAKEGNKWGFIDKDGNWIAQPVFDEVKTWRRGRENFGDGKMNDKWGPVDHDGNWKPAEDQIDFILSRL